MVALSSASQNKQFFSHRFAIPKKLLSSLKNGIEKTGPNFFAVDELLLQRCLQNPIKYLIVKFFVEIGNG